MKMMKKTMRRVQSTVLSSLFLLCIMSLLLPPFPVHAFAKGEQCNYKHDPQFDRRLHSSWSAPMHLTVSKLVKLWPASVVGLRVRLVDH
jgi:hypothetical protein